MVGIFQWRKWWWTHRWVVGAKLETEWSFIPGLSLSCHIPGIPPRGPSSPCVSTPRVPSWVSPLGIYSGSLRTSFFSHCSSGNQPCGFRWQSWPFCWHCPLPVFTSVKEGHVLAFWPSPRTSAQHQVSYVSRASLKGDFTGRLWWDVVQLCCYFDLRLNNIS